MTAANIISLLGLSLVIAGIMLAMRHEAGWAAGLIILGRLADLADGFVADKTGTKSPLGEAVDATVDKIAMGLIVLLLLTYDGPARWFGIVVLLHFLYQVGTFVMAYRRHFRLHPSAIGKYTAATLWGGVALYILGEAVESGIVTVLADMCAVIFTCLAVAVAIQYTKQVRRD
jgi:phosphatidylglycerophosphate synthase